MPISGQTPISAISEETVPPTATNFPALKHFFDVEKLVSNGGPQTLTDSVGGVTFPTSAVTPGNDAYSRTFTSLVGVDQDITGNWTQPDTTPVVMFGMGIGNSTGFIVGSSGVTNASDALRLVTVAGAGGAYDQSVGALDAFDNLTSHASTIRMFAMQIDVGGNINSYEYDGTTLTTNTANATTNVTALDSIGDVIGWNSATSYGMGIMHFTTLPSDQEMAAAVSWMYHAWLEGNKTIYPGWKDVV